jgi:hypothetical protein
MAAVPHRLALIVAAACLAGLAAGIVIGHYALPAPAREAAAAEATGWTAYRDQSQSEAMANVRAAVPAMEAWNADHGGYEGATFNRLWRKYDSTLHDVTVVFATRDDYCLESRAGGTVASKHGPSGEILPQPCTQ